MRSRNEEVPLAVELAQAEEQLHIFEAVYRAVHDAHAILDVLANAEDAAGARAALREQLGLDENQAAAVLDCQFRRVTRSDRRMIEERRAELAEHVAFLTHLDR